jgi:cellulose biosynthesis protein BcsQ
MHNVEKVLVFVGHEIPINPIIKIAENFDIEKRVIIVELDPLGLISKKYNVDNRLSAYDISQGEKYSNVVTLMENNRIFLLPGNINLTKLEDGAIEKIILYLKEKFDYILITTPPHQHTYILEAIQFANKTILVTTINKMSIYFTDKFLSIFSKLTDDISLLITEEDVDNEIYKILNQEFSDIEKIKDFKIK